MLFRGYRVTHWLYCCKKSQLRNLCVLKTAGGSAIFVTLLIMSGSL